MSNWQKIMLTCQIIMPTFQIIMSSLSDNYDDLLESDFSDSYANLIVKKYDAN